MKNETKEKESSITDETEEIWKIVQSELRDEARSDDGGGKGRTLSTNLFWKA